MHQRLQEIREMFRKQREDLAKLRIIGERKPVGPTTKLRELLDMAMSGFPGLLEISSKDEERARQLLQKIAARKILRAWRNFRSKWERESEIHVVKKAMEIQDGFYLFAILLTEEFDPDTTRLEIGFSKMQHVEISGYKFHVQYISTSGLMYRQGRSQRIRGAREFFRACQVGDELTVAVTVGIGLLTILNDRNGLVMRGPIGTELPIVGKIFPVMRTDEKGWKCVKRVTPQSVPLTSEIPCNLEWITSGPLLRGSTATLECTDVVDACCIGVTSEIGAACCASEIPVKPLWQVDFISGVAGEFSDHKQETRKIQFAIKMGDKIQVIVDKRRIEIRNIDNLVHKFEISENMNIFIIAEGFTLIRVDYD